MKPSKHLKAFSISIELLHEMMTVGWEVGTKHIVRCIEGLPQGARFEFIQHERYRNSVCLVFSHPTWPTVESADDIPHQPVVMRNISIKEPREASE